jgi:hypothetical protein
VECCDRVVQTVFKFFTVDQPGQTVVGSLIVQSLAEAALFGDVLEYQYDAVYPTRMIADERGRGVDGVFGAVATDQQGMVCELNDIAFTQGS